MTTQRHRYLQVVYFIHLIFGAVLLYAGLQYYKKKELQPIVYSLLLLMGFGAIGYHMYWLLDSFNNHHSD